MQTTIDRAGRVVIPKKLRDALNLVGGAEIDIDPAPGGLLLRVPGGEARLVEKLGFLVHQGAEQAGIDVANFINHQRDAAAGAGVAVP